MKLSEEHKAEISRLITAARENENSGKRSDLLRRYLGEPYGDEKDFRSKFVDTSAQDAVEALLPEIMDVYTSAENILEFAPVGEDDVAAAEQETFAVSHVFWQKNDGFTILYTWIKEAMIQQNSYVWAGWVEKTETEIHEYEGLDFEAFMGVLQQFEGEEYEIEEQTGVALLEDEATGEAVTVPDIQEDGTEAEISLRIRCVKTTKEYEVQPFPQEDFFVTPRWSELTLRGVPCCGRRHRDKTREDWISFGFDEKSIQEISEINDDEQASTRHNTQDTSETDESDAIEVYETYVLMDHDGDGSQELLRIWCTEDGNRILKWKGGKEAVEEVARLPFACLTPYIMPHRHIGQSVVERVDDIARVKTVLMRQLLDNIYTTNYPRPVINPDLAGRDAYEDLMNPAPGAPIRSRSPIEWQAPGSLAGSIMPVIEKLDGLQEMRTGATRYNQGLDAESLNKTASGISQIMGASQKKAKLIARTMAETGLRELFLGIHADLRSGPYRDMMLRLKGAWQPIDPTAWRSRSDMVVNVGMGRGDRDERRAGLTLIGQAQRELMAAGSRMVDEGKLYSTIEDTARTFGIDGAERYFNDPAMMPPPPPPPPPAPDPLMVSAQSQAQKVQADAQRDQAKLAADERDRERRHELEMQKLRLEEIKLTNVIQNERETLKLREQETVMRDDLERDKMQISGAPAVPYSEVMSDTP